MIVNMYNWLNNFFNEIRLNPGFKSKFIIVLYRLSSLRYRNGLICKYLFLIFHIPYFILVDFIMGVEIKAKTKIGWGLVIFHPVAIIINADAKIGKGCILRHCVTIGNKFNKKTSEHTASPTIGDNVEFGAGCTVIGPITIGSSTTIGANVFLDYSVDCHSIVFPIRGVLRKNRLNL